MHKRRKPRVLLLAVAGVCLLVLFGGLWLSFSQTGLVMGSRTYKYELADTETEREQGLSDRNSLPAGSAMLFVFDTPGHYCFWMKDMRFPLDMIWLDAQKHVIYTKENVSPSTYPESFCPTDTSSYVIEVNAGEAQRSGIKTGDTVRF